MQENCSYPETPSRKSYFSLQFWVLDHLKWGSKWCQMLLLILFLTCRVHQRSCVYMCVHNLFHPNEEILQCNYTCIQVCTQEHKVRIYGSLFASLFFFNLKMAQLLTLPCHCLCYHVLFCSNKLNYYITDFSILFLDMWPIFPLNQI